MASAGQVQRTEVLVQDLHIEEAPRQLPDTVFPISMKITMDRKTREDAKHPEVREPEYPFTARRAEVTPYVGTKKVYFYNPAELSNQPGKAGASQTWSHPEFVEKVDEAIAELEKEDPKIGDRLYLTGADFVEIPQEHVRYEDPDGNKVAETRVADYKEDLGHLPGHIRARAEPSLYKDRDTMVIARFGKRQRIRSKGAREKLKKELPRNIIKPLKLTEVAVVHAKEHRGSWNTSAASTKRMYFTTAQAEQYNDMDLAPVFYKEQEAIDDDSADVERPLRVIESEMDSRMPGLCSSGFVSEWEFSGRIDESEEFVDRDVYRGGF